MISQTEQIKIKPGIGLNYDCCCSIVKPEDHYIEDEMRKIFLESVKIFEYINFNKVTEEDIYEFIGAMTGYLFTKKHPDWDKATIAQYIVNTMISHKKHS